MTYDPKVLNATMQEKADAFEWLRQFALAGGKDWRKAAILVEEIARYGASAAPEEGVKIAELKRQLAAEREHGAALDRDATRYRYWREAHAQGLRPFLPEIGQGRLTERTVWTYLIYGDIHDDDWIKSTPAERCTLIDEAIDKRLPQRKEP